jgi:hypothetical protein
MPAPTSPPLKKKDLTGFLARRVAQRIEDIRNTIKIAK